MATIFDLSENTAPDGTDRLYITDGTNDEGVQISNLLKGSGAEVPAAKITGTVATSNLPTIPHEKGGLEGDVSAYDGIVQISGGATSALSTVTHERGGLEADVSAYDSLVRIAGGSTSNLKSNFSASAAPTTSDDSGSGYVVGSRWIDTTNDKEYVCLDNTATAAVWTETTGGGGGGGLTVSQVVHSSYDTTVTHASTYGDTNLSASITVSAGSDVLIIAMQNIYAGALSWGDWRILRGATQIYEMQEFAIFNDDDSYSDVNTVSATWLDSSLSAGTYTYKTQVKKTYGQIYSNYGRSTITLIELS